MSWLTSGFSPRWTAGVELQPAMSVVLSLLWPWKDLGLMLQAAFPGLHPALPLPAALAWCLHPVLPRCLPWACCCRHCGPSGAVELSLAPVLSHHGMALLLLLLDVPALPKEEGSFSPTEHCNITYSRIWCSLLFSDLKADVVTSSSAAERAIFPFLPGWSWTSWDRTGRLPQALPWVPLGHLMPALQLSLSMNNESSHLPAMLQGMVEPPLEQQIIELRA